MKEGVKGEDRKEGRREGRKEREKKGKKGGKIEERRIIRPFAIKYIFLNVV